MSMQYARLAMREQLPLRTAAGRLAAAGVDFFTPADLELHLGITRRKAYDLAQRMTRANLARRLKKGFYALLPPADWVDAEGFAVNRYWTAANLMRGRPYFIAYYTAMDLHQMTQHPIRTVFVAVTRQQRDMTVGPVRFRFVTLTEARFFGAETRKLEGNPVEIADLERTFLDCVDRMELCGGLEEVVRGFDRRHRDLDREKLLRYILQFDGPVAAKRLGLLLELVGHGDVRLFRELERTTPRLGFYAPLEPGGEPQATERNRRWELDVNADMDKLLHALKT
jgi:predicted transcriptional regulator of viral defense system